MNIKALLFAPALSALSLPVLAHEQAPSYTWAEVSFGTQHQSAQFPDSLSFRAEALRLASNFRVMPNVYLLAAYTTADFSYGDANEASVGLGAYAPLRPALHAVLQLTYEQLEFKNGGSTDIEFDGAGAEAGLRWRPGVAQFDLALKHASLEGEPYAYADRYTGIKFAALLPMGAALGLSFRFERMTFSGDLADGMDADTYLLGLRYGFGDS